MISLNPSSCLFSHHWMQAFLQATILLRPHRTVQLRTGVRHEHEQHPCDLQVSCRTSPEQVRSLVSLTVAAALHQSIATAATSLSLKPLSAARSPSPLTHLSMTDHNHPAQAAQAQGQTSQTAPASPPPVHDTSSSSNASANASGAPQESGESSQPRIPVNSTHVCVCVCVHAQPTGPFPTS